MFDRNHNIENPDKEIRELLDKNQSGCQSIRRRAVMYKTKDGWDLLACVVEGISVVRSEIQKQSSRFYSKACLYEDWISLEQLSEFITQIAEGEFRLGAIGLEATYSHRNWSSERLPLRNNEMAFAGYVWRARFSDNVHGVSGELLSPKQPYYPDLHEAVRDWLPYPVYHGSSDSRKGEIAFLFPETRAYFEDINPMSDSIELSISGSEVDELELEVKGAWWDEDGIHHFTVNAVGGRAKLAVPISAKRLEYVLAGTDGEVYDFQKEYGDTHTGLGRSSKTGKNRTLISLVEDSRRNGEGPTIEFKPFIDPKDSKLDEVIRTVAAFANAGGGKIFLGISDGCELIGIEEGLGKWAKSEANEMSCEQYLGIIKGKVRDQISKHVDINFNQLVVGGLRVIVIEVGEAKNKPVTIRKEEKVLFIRRGASNVKASPEEWNAICNASKGMHAMHNIFSLNNDH